MALINFLMLVVDTTKIEIVGKQLDKIVNSIVNRPSSLSTGEVALIAAAIGASAAIISQLAVFYLNRLKEKKNLKNELIAQERQVAYLLAEYYKELVMHKVHKQYWYKAAEISASDLDESKDSHERHFKSNQRGFEVKTKISMTTAEYFKIVSHYINLTSPNKNITDTLNDIKKFTPRRASTFSGITVYSELLAAVPDEEKELNEVYRFYSECFDKINSEMLKAN